MLELTLLPARQGDALWIRWGNPSFPHQMLIDMGTEAIGRKMRERLEALDESARKFELLVVTHVDRDHIGGILTCLAEADEPLEGVSFDDVWFNGWVHLDGGKAHQPASAPSVGANATGLESFGPAQGERLSSWLREQVWNKAFDGGPVWRKADQVPKTVTLADGLRLTVLGPTPERLIEFKPKWEEEVREALEKGSLDEVSAGLEAFGSKEPPLLEAADDLEILAETNTTSDGSEANGSSIALLLEYRGRRLVLSGDAFAADLVDGLKAIMGQQPMGVDAFKLPHHGSKKNISKELVESVSCPQWLFSTDGTQFRHPDAVALARVISYSRSKPPLVSFNVRSKYNDWWDNPDWKDRYQYTTQYGNENDGLTLQFEIEEE